MTTTVNLEHLSGRRVLSPRGKSVGHIEEIRAEQVGGDLVVTEFHVGIYAALERLSAFAIGSALLDLFSLRRRDGFYRIPWDMLDISDPKRPRLLCPMTELTHMKGRSQTLPAKGKR
ncbi:MULTISPECIES: hypothetical protein [unclassified Mesorhizobium]|uniref:PRC-barrel domain-containing protein n=1 Tax=unclassified Mesorhizobium TaxID=325217 RepID=UPI00109357F8|nr:MULTISPECIES: hypothetical protein [unclassified Mesorhizobium]TGU40187.1 hypothetical protein EN799_07150 [bacterium M00.F.Ca.ET.156.01.1.1]TGQ77137.1 hypothetical protein EN850_29660 [Mesorhizobium sp. M8A.F.Ca.ET.207.01.1.1]TGQ89204.1 hypothetical protein EN851_23335 [Mesorhizobium sp. M8A.F.Ca.ET.208.01.1.1]TGR32307.1 hypothetical protein EN845_07150 [Mesorhizobium sp. M8A.F.Ca.ET.202.01.1.1]TGS38110.1 hypothetical protein EN825_30190 [Mesorhizobium sp. M8A.F.Ca.ET.182.01.1.1]